MLHINVKKSTCIIVDMMMISTTDVHWRYRHVSLWHYDCGQNIGAHSSGTLAACHAPTFNFETRGLTSLVTPIILSAKTHTSLPLSTAWVYGSVVHRATGGRESDRRCARHVHSGCQFYSPLRVQTSR